MSDTDEIRDDPFRRAERRALKERVAALLAEEGPRAVVADDVTPAGVEPPCPRCGCLMHARRVDPGPQVAYVRHRLLLVCPCCHRAASVDIDLPPEPSSAP